MTTNNTTNLEALFLETIENLNTRQDLVNVLEDGEGVYFKEDSALFIRSQRVKLNGGEYVADVFFSPNDEAGVMVSKDGKNVGQFFTDDTLQTKIRLALGDVLPIWDEYSLDSYSSWVLADVSNHVTDTFTNVLAWGSAGEAVKLDYSKISEKLEELTGQNPEECDGFKTYY